MFLYIHIYTFHRGWGLPCGVRGRYCPLSPSSQRGGVHIMFLSVLLFGAPWSLYHALPIMAFKILANAHFLRSVLHALVHTYIYMHLHPHIHIHTHLDIDIQMHIHIHMHTHQYVTVYIDMCMHMCIQYNYMYIYICIFMYIYIYIQTIITCLQTTYIFIYKYIYVYTHIT